MSHYEVISESYKWIRLKKKKRKIIEAAIPKETLYMKAKKDDEIEKRS